MRNRIEKAIADSGKRPAEIAHEVGVSTAAVSQWITRDTKSLKAENMLALAAATGKNPLWLATGKGPENAPQMGDSGENGSHLIGASVPVVEWSTLAVADFGQSFNPATMAASRTLCPVKHGSKTFAFRVPDDSNSANSPGTIPLGFFVWIDPDQTTVPHGKPALARIIDGGQIVLAHVMEQAGRRWLHFLNPAYPPIHHAFEVIGRVIFKGEET